MKILKIFSVFLLLCYAAICAFLYSQQNKLIYFPQPKDLENAKTFKQFSTEIQNDGIVLHGWSKVQNVSPENPVVFYYGGNGDEASRNISVLAEMGFKNFVAMNYRGYGRSGGQPEEKDLKEDALHILDEIVKTNGIQAESIILIGRSLGSGIASYVASEREVAKVVLITPYDSIVKVAQKRFPLFPVSTLLKQRFESDKLAPSIDKPMLCLIAGQDQIIPKHHAIKLCELWKGVTQKVVFEKANHNNIKEHPDFISTVSRFVK